MLFCTYTDVTQDDLVEFFQSCGAIKKLSYPLDKFTKKPRGIAFVTFETSKGLYEAMSRDGDALLRDKIRIRRNTPKPSHTEGELSKDVGNKRSFNKHETTVSSSKHPRYEHERRDEQSRRKEDSPSPARRREQSRRKDDSPSPARRREQSRRKDDSPSPIV